jgi:hypothetical protein
MRRWSSVYVAGAQHPTLPVLRDEKEAITLDVLIRGQEMTKPERSHTFGDSLDALSSATKGIPRSA